MDVFPFFRSAPAAAVAAVLLCAAPAAADSGPLKILTAKNTQYQYLSVHEDKKRKERYLRSKRGEVNYGGISLDNPESLLLAYTRIAFIGLAFLDHEPKDALFLGLGVGAMPRYFSRYYPGAAVDVVEIDPDVPPLARKYFFFKETPRMKLAVEDGRIFVKRAKGRYDVIFLDAYQNDLIPFHLTTLEFLREVRAKLKPGGVVVANIFAKDINRFFDASVRTYRKAFPQVYVFKWKYDENYLFVATESSIFRDQLYVGERAEKLQALKGFDLNLPWISQWYSPAARYERAEADVLTDDFAPVSIYQHQKTGRKP